MEFVEDNETRTDKQTDKVPKKENLVFVNIFRITKKRKEMVGYVGILRY